MTSAFFPSLQHLAAVRVALAIYNEDIHLFEVLVYKRTSLDDKFQSYISTEQEKWINERKLMTENIILPKTLKNSISQVFLPLVEEINFWFRDHFHVVKHIEKSHYTNSLRWKSEGTIDRMQTAKQIVWNERIDKRVRFVMAGIYFWESDVLNLWQSMTADERNSIYCIDHNVATRFWVEWLRKDTKSPWTQSIKEIMDVDVPPPLVDNWIPPYEYSRVRLSSFIIHLDSHRKILFLYLLWPEYVHIDDMRLCFNLMNEYERKQVLSISPISDALRSYLQWPTQSIFLDIVNQVKSLLGPSDFGRILNYIVMKKLMRGAQDFDYLQLLKDLWYQIPDPYKVKINRHREFVFIQAALTYDEEVSPLTLEELLGEVRINFRY